MVYLFNNELALRPQAHCRPPFLVRTTFSRRTGETVFSGETEKILPAFSLSCQRKMLFV